jgi:hypothetical protein
MDVGWWLPQSLLPVVADHLTGQRVHMDGDYTLYRSTQYAERLTNVPAKSTQSHKVVRRVLPRKGRRQTLPEDDRYVD